MKSIARTFSVGSTVSSGSSGGSGASRARAWRCSFAAKDLAVHSIELASACDRPDRLCVDFPFAPNDEAAHTSFAAAMPSRVVRLESDGDTLFEGFIVSRSVDHDDGARRARVVAYAPYEFRRAQLGSETYFQLSDGEIASRIAMDLGLEPKVEPTPFVHERLCRDGDPLRFLRSRARAIGFELAIADGCLWFARELPAVDEVSSTRSIVRVRPGVVATGIALRRASLEERYDMRSSRNVRGGELEVSGDERLLPLSRLDLQGFDTALDGEYCVLRSVHTRDACGYRTRTRILDRGADLESWEKGGARVEP